MIERDRLLVAEWVEEELSNKYPYSGRQIDLDELIKRRLKGGLRARDYSRMTGTLGLDLTREAVRVVADRLPGWFIALTVRLGEIASLEDLDLDVEKALEQPSSRAFCHEIALIDPSRPAMTWGMWKIRSFEEKHYYPVTWDRPKLENALVSFEVSRWVAGPGVDETGEEFEVKLEVVIKLGSDVDGS